MDKKHKVSLWYIVLGFWGILILHNLLVSAFAIKTIPYSEFLQLLKEGKVSEVAISSNQIQGRIGPTGEANGKATLFRTVPEATRVAIPLESGGKGERSLSQPLGSSPCIHW